MSASTICYVLSVVFFGLGALSVSVPRINWTDAGLCLFVIGFALV